MRLQIVCDLQGLLSDYVVSFEVFQVKFDLGLGFTKILLEGMQHPGSVEPDVVYCLRVNERIISSHQILPGEDGLDSFCGRLFWRAPLVFGKNTKLERLL